ncbi:MAG: mechanosensitive ion channel [Anaeromyxobacter sp.]
MDLRRWVPGFLLLALLAAVGAGLYLTREPDAPPADPQAEVGRARPPGAGGEAAPGQPGQAGQPAQAGQAGAPPRRERVVNPAPVLTARRLSALAETPEEQELSRQAERLADHAVDLAFAEALRRIAEEPPEVTPQVKALAEARDRAESAAGAAQGQVDELTRKLIAAPGSERPPIVDHLEVARAQLELARDELEEAREELARAGGDPQARIQRLKAAYDAAQKETRPPPVLAPDTSATGSLLVRGRALAARREKVAKLETARADALAEVQRLGGVSERINARLRKAAEESAAQGAQAAGADGTLDPATRQANALRQAAAAKRRLTAIARRQQDQQELADVYGEWTAIARRQQSAAAHRGLLGLATVLIIALITFAGLLGVDRFFAGREQEQLRAGTLRTVARLAVQLAGVLAAVFVVFGTPGQLTTILGLAGAGLTVALKDFIVAFFGWFVLMGRNGLRVGDWVEIKGVGGEVAEIGLLHTVLLETGSWTDAGHPTGRRVSFVNSFAIEGHYFNFSTSGQWMWDTLQVLVPLGQDPYPIIDGLQHLVEGVTEANAREAEQEWRRTTTRYRVRTFSAVPGINVVPTSGGVQLDVRYITRAYERHETRRRLYQSVIELMHGKRAREGGAPR